MIQLRKYNHQTFLLRFKEDSEFKRMYVSIGADRFKGTKQTSTKSNKNGGKVSFQRKSELFERAVDDTFKKYQPNNIDEETQITGQRNVNKDEFLFSLEFEPREDSDFTKEMKEMLKQINKFNENKLKSMKMALERYKKEKEPQKNKRSLQERRINKGQGMIGGAKPPEKKNETEYIKNLHLSIREQKKINDSESNTDVGFKETNIHSVLSEFFKPKL